LVRQPLQLIPVIWYVCFILRSFNFYYKFRIISSKCVTHYGNICMIYTASICFRFTSLDCLNWVGVNPVFFFDYSNAQPCCNATDSNFA
jgi:hypothetical protein